MHIDIETNIEIDSYFYTKVKNKSPNARRPKLNWYQHNKKLCFHCCVRVLQNPPLKYLCCIHEIHLFRNFVLIFHFTDICFSAPLLACRIVVGTRNTSTTRISATSSERILIKNSQFRKSNRCAKAHVSSFPVCFCQPWL